MLWAEATKCSLAGTTCVSLLVPANSCTVIRGRLAALNVHSKRKRMIGCKLFIFLFFSYFSCFNFINTKVACDVHCRRMLSLNAAFSCICGSCGDFRRDSATGFGVLGGLLGGLLGCRSGSVDAHGRSFPRCILPFCPSALLRLPPLGDCIKHLHKFNPDNLTRWG